MIMANLIATEYYAYSIGGSGSYNSNLCCTKSRATQLNCSVSGSYSNNQLVPQNALSRSSSGGGSSGWTTTSSYSISGYTIYKSYGKEGVANSDTTQQFQWSSGTTVYIGSSSESGYDIVYITNSSGSQVGSSVSGSHTPSSLSNMTSVSISSSGYYTIHYKKDGSANSGDDCGYLAVPNGGSSGGGGGSSGSYYAYYYVDSSQKYYRTTSSQTRSKSDWSGASNYNYQGYIYYDTLSQALNQYNGSASSCDSTSSTYSGSSTVVVFFFTSNSGGGDSGGDSGGGSTGGGGGSSSTHVYYYTVDGTQLYSTTGSHTAASNYSGYGLIGRTSSATLSNALSTSSLEKVTTSVSGSCTVFWYANSSNISINISSNPSLTYETFTYAGQTQTPSRCGVNLSVTAGRFTLVPDRYINVLSNSYGISLETTRLMKGTVYSLGSNNSVTCHSYGGRDFDHVYYKLRYTSSLGSSATKTTSEFNDNTGSLVPGIVINY